MRIRVELHWELDVPSDAELDKAVEEAFVRIQDVPFGDVAGQFTVARIDEVAPWEIDFRGLFS